MSAVFARTVTAKRENSIICWIISQFLIEVLWPQRFNLSHNQSKLPLDLLWGPEACFHPHIWRSLIFLTHCDILKGGVWALVCGMFQNRFHACKTCFFVLNFLDILYQAPNKSAYLHVFFWLCGFISLVLIRVVFFRWLFGEVFSHEILKEL